MEEGGHHLHARLQQALAHRHLVGVPSNEQHPQWRIDLGVPNHDGGRPFRVKRAVGEDPRVYII
jgi:hypothetical protein